MDAGWPVDSPRRHVLPAIGARRHRRLTMPSGLLLLACLFLPAVKSCGSSVTPIETPYFWHPYLYGGGLAIAALASTLRGVRVATIALRVLGYLSVGGGAVLVALSPTFGFVELVLGGVLLGVIGLRGVAERRIATTGIVVSVLSLLWFGLWAGSSGALVGVYVSLGASIFLLAGSLLWLSEI